MPVAMAALVGDVALAAALRRLLAARLVAESEVFGGIFAPHGEQAAVTFRRVLGMLCAVPVVERTIVRALSESIEFDNDATIEIINAAPRRAAR